MKKYLIVLFLIFVCVSIINSQERCKNDIFYQVEAKYLIDIDENELLKLNQSGWILSDDTNFLEFYV